MYEIVLSLDQVDIVKVKAGMPALVTLDAFPGESFTGVVSSISALPTEVSGVISYEAKIQLQIEKENIYSKMGATIEVTTGESINTLVVPAAAIYTEDGRYYLEFGTSEDALVKREVTLGLSDIDSSEILS